MKIYIASSWKNQHAVEMLTALLRERNHEVISWIENNYLETYTNKKFDFEQWVESNSADKSFDFDTDGAMNCDLLVYLGPAGKDAVAEAAMAFAKGKTVVGLWAKGEDIGLMRKMMSAWFDRYTTLLNFISSISHVFVDKAA